MILNEFKYQTILVYCVLFCIQFLNIPQQAYSQNNVQISNPVPVSPQSAAFAKYGEVPVSLTTGIPNITIPIENIVVGDINLPVNLSYHAGGIRVEEIASSVGLGWTLNFGGVVTRQTRGLPDDTPFGYETTGNSVQRYLNNEMTYNERQSFMTAFRHGHIDGEKDVYNFSTTTGLSGKFIMDDNGKFISIPKSNIRIERVINSSQNCWKITDEFGIAYYFLAVELNSTANVVIVDGNATYSSGYTSEPTAWYLTKIQDTKGNEINFSYNANWVGFTTKGQQTKNVFVSSNTTYYDCGEALTTVSVANNISTPRIKEISWQLGKIKFNYQNVSRQDLLLDTALSTIELINSVGAVISKTKLTSSYFISPYFYTADPSIRYRLRLDSINKVTTSGEILPGHKFIYRNDQGGTDRLSNSHDYWGYFNGKTNAEYVSYNYRGPNNTYFRSGADKSIDTAKTKELSLTEIIYPTGGKTSFEYEGNNYSVYKNAFYTYNSSPIAAVSGDNSGGSPGQVAFEFNQTFSLTSADINNSSSSVTLKAIVYATCDNPNAVFCLKEAKIIPSTGTPIYLNNNSVINLPPGNYTLNGKVETEFSGTPYAYVSASLIKGILNPAGFYEAPAGGMRIKRIYNLSGNSILGIKEFQYTKIGSAYSSGTINNYNVLPDYNRIEIHHSAKTDPISNIVTYFDCGFDVYSSSSNYPLNNINGGTTLYGNVTVLDKNVTGQTNGKVENYFTNFQDFGDIENNVFPFPPITSFEWKRGLPYLVKEYKQNSNNSYTLVREKFSKYKFHDHQSDTSRRVFKGIKIGQMELFNIPPGTYGYIGIAPEVLNALQVQATYNTITEVFYPIKDSVVEYNSGTSDKIITIDSFVYSLYPILVKKKVSINSKNQVVETSIKYPSDLASVSIFNSMKDKNMLAFMIEVSQRNHTLSKNIRKGYTSFKNWHSTIPLPDTIWTSTADNALEAESVVSKYSSKGKVEEMKDRKGITTSFIWGYNNEYLVAVVVGKSHALAISQTSLNVSLLNNLSSTETAIRNELNKLRTLTGCQVTTYTYKPLIGISSVTDPNNFTTYYNYDALNRLYTVIDKDNRILQKYCYNYSGQPVACDIFFSDDKSGLYTRNNCGAGFTGGYVNVNIPAGMFSSTISKADANNQATSYGQTQANITGTCTSSSVTVQCNNTVSGGTFYMQYYNQSTGQMYNFNVSNTGYNINLGSIPAGTYTITIGSSIYNTNFYYSVACGFFNYGNNATFYNVNVDNTCKLISISPY